MSRLGPTPYPPAWADTEPTSRPPISRSPASIVVVAATRVRLSRLMALIESAPFEVHGIARSVDGAVLLVTESQPAAVLLDLGAASGGLDLVERLMARVPTPIVITGAAAASASEALALGAVAVVGDETEMLGAGPYAAELISHLTVATRVRVITHPRGRLRDQARSIPTPVDVPSLSGGPTVAAVPAVPFMTAGPTDDAVAVPASRAPRRRPSVVAIGASTGGPAALVGSSWAMVWAPAIRIRRNPSAPSRPIPVSRTPTARSRQDSAMQRNVVSTSGTWNCPGRRGRILTR